MCNLVCALKLFCDFLEASSLDQQKSIVRRYKKGTTERAKGMMVYYSPALQMMRGRLCPSGTLPEKLQVLRTCCVIEKWTDKLNDARIQANVLVFNAFHAQFGNRKLKVFASPRLQCLLTSEVAVNIQPELYAEVDGTPMVWKLNMSRTCPSETTISYILQMMNRALLHKGLTIPIEQVCFLDLRSGQLYAEATSDPDFEKKLLPVTKALADTWKEVA